MTTLNAASLVGSMTALATPFRDGKFDEAAYRALVEQQVAGGTAVLVPIGTTGEAVTMSAQERFRTVQLAVEAARGRVRVVAGAGAQGTAETVENVRQLREAGADGALVVTPFYTKPTQAGLVEHYRAVARAHPGFPLVAYNVPGRTAVDLLPETVQRLADVPEVVGLKEATASMVRVVDIVERIGTERIALISGDDFTVAPFIALGGKGVISVSSNVAPRMMADLVAASLEGDFARARALQVRMNALHRLLFVEASPIPVKWGLHLLGLFGPELRLPLVPMTEGNTGKLRAEMAKLALL